MDNLEKAQAQLLSIKKEYDVVSIDDIDNIVADYQLTESELDDFILWINKNDLAIDTYDVDIKVEDSYENAYYQEIGQYPLLDSQQEAELARRVRNGDMIARDTLIKSNLRLVVAIAQKYKGGTTTVNDLIQEGNMGLVKAVERYDPDKGIRFAVYATYWIRQAMSRAIIENRTIHLPVNVSELIHQLDRIEKNMEQELGREVTDEELAQRAGLSSSYVEQLKSYDTTMISIDKSIGDDNETSIAEIIPGGVSASREVDRQLLREQLTIALRSLNDRNLEIITLRYGLDGQEPMTLQQIGERYGLTKERVRQIINESLATIKEVGTSLIDFVESVDDQQAN